MSETRTNCEAGFRGDEAPGLTWQRAGQRAGMGDVSQRHRGRPVDHEVVGDRLPVVLHLRTEDALTHEVDGPDHEERHDHDHDEADGVAGRRRRRLLGGV